MSGWGQTRTPVCISAMSALPPVNGHRSPKMPCPSVKRGSRRSPLKVRALARAHGGDFEERAADQPFVHFTLGCGRTSVESARAAHLQSDGKRIHKRYRCAVSSARDFGLLFYDCFRRSSHNYIPIQKPD